MLASTVPRRRTAGARDGLSCASWPRRSHGTGSSPASRAFTSVTPGTDLARLATEQDADLLLVDAPAGLLEDARVISLLDHAPCDVAVVVGERAPRAGPVLVPFSGAEHDWAAVELGAWLAQALDRPLQLAGASTGAGGRDASRLLASASLALQRALGVHAEPLIVEPVARALVAAARGAGAVVVGLTERWRREGLGRARTALATEAAAPTLLVRRGLRPGRARGAPGRHALHVDDRGIRRLISRPRRHGARRGGSSPGDSSATPTARAARRATGRRRRCCPAATSPSAAPPPIRPSDVVDDGLPVGVEVDAPADAGRPAAALSAPGRRVAIPVRLARARAAPPRPRRGSR